ncbi:MAG: methyltransferase domain-containing protein [Phycisphaerales bacterium]|jgi:SAM-dependent methyltransferase|nr:methyltransferase domain-containing protein [Phycisphaerales bacterium]
MQPSLNYPYPDQARDDILRMIPEDGRVIGSIGCGSGATEWELIKTGRQVHGVDVEANAIELAARRLTSARVVAGDELQPFAPDSLDGLILADVIEHLPRAWDRLARFTLCVKPGGWVAISVPNMRNLKVLWTFMVRGDWPEEPIGIFDATHLQVLSVSRLERWCRLAGLRPERWFDKYLSAATPRSRWLRAADALSGRIFHEWFQMQLQVLARRV